MTAELKPIRTAAETGLAEAFAALRPRLAGTAAAARREAAFRRFEAAGLPHRRIEEWKYTDLRALMRDAKPLAAPPDAAAIARARNAGATLAGIDARRIVFVDGLLVPELSDLTPEPGLTISSLRDALGSGNPAVLARLGDRPRRGRHRLCAQHRLHGRRRRSSRSRRTPVRRGRCISSTPTDRPAPPPCTRARW